MKKPFPLSKVYCLMEPGPVVLITTAEEGKPNVMPMSWHMMMEFEPPLIGCVVSSRNFSFGALLRTGECVINIPTVELAEKVVGCGNVSGRSVDKFKQFDLTAVDASQVKAPLIQECYASLECVVADSDFSGKYNLFVLEVRQAWVDPQHKEPKTIHHQGWGSFRVAGETIELVSHKK
ncbi:MAG TPA: flavin reductase family protein [Geomonas sp.]|nr:flavin reductase family protein [Geomonas sp.]